MAYSFYINAYDFVETDDIDIGERDSVFVEVYDYVKVITRIVLDNASLVSTSKKTRKH